MTNPIHNLDEDAAEYFEFILGGHTYKMRYPTTEDVEAADKLSTDEEKKAWMYSFIAPVGEAPSIDEALKKSNIKVVRNFNTMISTEFGE